MKKITISPILTLLRSDSEVRGRVRSLSLFGSLALHFLFLLIIYQFSLVDERTRELIVLDLRFYEASEPLISEGMILKKSGERGYQNQGGNIRSQDQVEREVSKPETGPEMRNDIQAHSLNQRESGRPSSDFEERSERSELQLRYALSTEQAVSTEGGAKIVTRGEGREDARGRGGDEASKRYLKENFQYIREIIARNTYYPPLARRMGWSGRVTLSFVVTEDGTVRDIQIIEGSGYDILDRSAVETIRRSAPFPRPPLSVKIIVPIVYKLN